MIILDKKSYDLLSYLLKLEEPETVMAISKKLNQSRRKIYYHLDKINEALPLEVDKIISYPRVGIALTTKQKLACQELMIDLDDYNYVLHVQERLQLILIAIAVAHERITIDRLMLLTDVSRNTVLNDLNLIRQQLAQDPHGIKLEVTKTEGYYLKSNPLTKIRYLYQLLHEVHTKGNTTFVLMLREKIAELTQVPIYFSDKVLCYFQKQVHQAKEHLGKKLNSQESELMLSTLPYLLSSYRSKALSCSEQSQLEEDFLMAKQRKEYALAQQMAQGLQAEQGVLLDDMEVSLISMLLLSYRKDSDSHLESRDYAQMREDLQAFVGQFEERYQLSFVNKPDLLRQLLTHCKSLIYRKVYGILSSNPLTEHIINKYGELFYMTQACVPLLEEAWGIALTTDDVAYLTIHLGGALRMSQEDNRRRLILVCDEGIGVQKLFLNQCKRYLKEVNIEAVFTSEQLDSVRDLLTADLLVSTVELDQPPLPTLVVNPVLSHEDVVRLVRFVSQRGQPQSQDLSQELERYLRQHLKNDTDIYVLRNKLEKLLHQEILAAITVTQGHPIEGEK